MPGNGYPRRDEYLEPLYTPSTLDLFLGRKSILWALNEALSQLQGTLLDVGCGNMPYRSVILSPSTSVDRYIGLDISIGKYHKPDITWNGHSIPLADNSVNCAMATEVLEHCHEPEILLQETCRVVKPGGVFFCTVPFLWPLHDIPNDAYRYTPWALERHLTCSGFGQVQIKALGGWDASLAQMIGLWVRRRPMTKYKRSILSWLALPAMHWLISGDQPPQRFNRSTMITGLSGIAVKPMTNLWQAGSQ